METTAKNLINSLENEQDELNTKIIKLHDFLKDDSNEVTDFQRKTMENQEWYMNAYRNVLLARIYDLQKDVE